MVRLRPDADWDRVQRDLERGGVDLLHEEPLTDPLWPGLREALIALDATSPSDANGRIIAALGAAGELASSLAEAPASYGRT